MRAKDGTLTTYTHTHTHKSVFFWDNCFWSFFVIVDKKKLGKLWNYFVFCFYTVNLTNFAPFVSGNFCQILRYHKIERKKNSHRHKDLIHGFDFLSYEWHGSAHKFELP